jgi:hypothetical protein
LLATVTISTVGVNSNMFNLRMTGMATSGGGSATNFAGIAANITNGHVGDIQVPEPSSIVLVLFALAGLFAIAIRKRRARRTA